MIDASSGGALMNKTPEEAWEMIETMADVNQHFSTRAKNSGIHEIAPSESTFLMKSLLDIATMLKEIKEGQPVTLVTLKQQADNSQQKPIKNVAKINIPTNPTPASSTYSRSSTISTFANHQRVPYAIHDENMAFGWANHEEEEEEEEEEDEYFNLLDLDDFVDYWELALPPSPASDVDDE
ncbi:hypothetical protein PIB30_018766 [Stylosanthes scabra]|uniref:Uncharacterized protein n=1 Tax=Stylosanthes scabra TaxID=79078 RepID=A0ABU6Q7U9_9FABA|nr:hypothetical protein [Stylosanthes scabra]